MTMRLYFLAILLMVGITLCSCGQNQSSVRNKIFVKNNVYELADSLAVIGSLLQRLPKDEMINYFLDLDGNLYVNNRKLGPLKGAEKNMSIGGHQKIALMMLGRSLLMLILSRLALRRHFKLLIRKADLL